MYDLSFQRDRERLAATINAEVEADSVAEYDSDFRWHLGASLIGHECERYLWNSFRWLKREAFSGRMLRLFQRGHFEEPKFISRLRRIGFEIFDLDGDGNQFRISGHGGHYGGSLDSVAIAPVRYGIEDRLLVEFKTHNDKSFVKLKKEGVRKSKPRHYKQMCSYGQAYGLKYALYVAINKNNDELYFEIVALDWNEGTNLYAKAGRIIFSHEPTAKIAQSIAYFECKTCVFGAICHTGATPDKNCRSCDHSMPVENGEWHCRLVQDIIPRDFVPKGCDSWRRIV